MNKKFLYNLKNKYLKIILCLIILSFLSSCSFKIQTLNNVTTTVYIDSIGIDYNSETNKYILYYHSSSSFSLITSEMGSINSNSVYSIASSEKDNLYEAIKEISLNTNRNILLTHVRSVIFSLNFINDENLKMFNEFIKSYKFINIDFNLYATDIDLKELFSYRDPESTNSYYSIITEIDEIIPFNAVKYNDFANAMYEPYIPVKLIYISMSRDIWSDNNGELNTLYTKGYVYYDNNTLLELESNYFKFVNLMYENYETHLIFDNVSYTLINPKVKITDSTIKIKAPIYITNMNEENKKELLNNLEYNIINEFKKIYNYSLSNGIDIFSIKDKLYRKGMLNDDINLDIKSFTFEFDFKVLS